MELDSFKVYGKRVGLRYIDILTAVDKDTGDMYRYVRELRSESASRIELNDSQVLGPTFDWVGYYKLRGDGVESCLINDNSGVWKQILKKR